MLVLVLVLVLVLLLLLPACRRWLGGRCAATQALQAQSQLPPLDLGLLRQHAHPGSCTQQQRAMQLQ